MSTPRRLLRLLRIPHTRVQNLSADARKLFVIRRDIEIETTHDVVGFETFAECQDPCEVDVVHGQVEV